MNLAVFFDGTWNDPADRTNVHQLRDRVVPVADDGTAQDARYIAGVGTGPWNRIRGGVFGMGLGANVRRGYAWLAEHHAASDDDRIYLIGFSRGSFTARSLARDDRQVRAAPAGGHGRGGGVRALPAHEPRPACGRCARTGSRPSRTRTGWSPSGRGWCASAASP